MSGPDWVNVISVGLGAFLGYVASIAVEHVKERRDRANRLTALGLSVAHVGVHCLNLSEKLESGDTEFAFGLGRESQAMIRRSLLRIEDARDLTPLSPEAIITAEVATARAAQLVEDLVGCLGRAEASQLPYYSSELKKIGDSLHRQSATIIDAVRKAMPWPWRPQVVNDRSKGPVGDT